jgi:hypothetical protein
MGEGADDTETSLLGWNDATGRYDRPMVIPTDDIRRVEIM